MAEAEADARCTSLCLCQSPEADPDALCTCSLSRTQRISCLTPWRVLCPPNRECASCVAGQSECASTLRTGGSCFTKRRASPSPGAVWLKRSGQHSRLGALVVGMVRRRRESGGVRGHTAANTLRRSDEVARVLARQLLLVTPALASFHVRRRQTVAALGGRRLRRERRCADCEGTKRAGGNRRSCETSDACANGEHQQAFVGRELGCALRWHTLSRPRLRLD
mmetsp:Transcript_4297/g.11141  ORF Transcript_4297/g.11141 Transcript_4297/m.11141 type:complete len:223 (+) Transcript_4297:184-852(+)